MAEEVRAKAKTSDSADLTMTKEYLVIKGKHFEIRNSYLYSLKQTRVVTVKDILSMEYLTVRSKRMFQVFMILMTMVVFGGAGIHKVLSAASKIDREVQQIENVYNYVMDESVDINISGTIKGALSEIGLTGIVMLYGVLIIGSVISILYYLLRPYKVLYISTLGMIIAVERKFYNKTQLDCIVNTWKMQL